MYKVERLQKEDYDGLLNFLDSAFEYTRESGFIKLLPAMWHRDNTCMGKNIAIKHNGNIIAAMGIYPLHTTICGKELLFATTGNVAVDSNYRNKGLMKQIMDAAAEELVNIGADVARLGGDRQRYNRYGYEYAGSSNQYTLTAKNVQNIPKLHNYAFKKLARTDTDALNFVSQLQSNKSFFVNRGNTENFFDVMSAWGNIPYTVSGENGGIVGALTVSPDLKTIWECYALSAETEFEILCSWVENNDIDALSFCAPQWETSLNRCAGRWCETAITEYSTQCKILNWEKLTDALLALKKTYCSINGNKSFVLEIKNYGCIEITCNGCHRTDKTPDLCLGSLDATRFLFGNQAPENICQLPAEKAGFIHSLLPLPLWWNNQDRV